MDEIDESHTPGAAEGSLSDALETNTEGRKAPEYFFVSDNNYRGMRSHAMREHWKQRRDSHASARRPRVPPLSPRLLLPKDDPKRVQRTTANSSIKATSSAEADFYRPFLSQRAGRYSQTDKRAHRIPTPRNGSEEFLTGYSTVGGLPFQLSAAMDRALVNTRFDPFDSFPVRLEAQHHKLLHHWLGTYAAMMFDDVKINSFNPVRDIWFPLDMSNAASFNLILAHSAAHMAHLHRYGSSQEAVKFKTDAVCIIAKWMDDPKRALSDDNIAAVVRLVTYEKHWGVENEWQIHRDGLQRMIDARGGLVSLRTNWRLELTTYLFLLMSQPSWLDSSNNVWRLSKPLLISDSQYSLCSAESLHKLRSLWLISVIQDLRTLSNRTLPRSIVFNAGDFPAIREMTTFLQNESDLHKLESLYQLNCTDRELERLACLFFVCVLLHQTTSLVSSTAAHLRTHGFLAEFSSMQLLERSLRDHRQLWQESTEGLYKLIFHELVDLPERKHITAYVLGITEVLRSMNRETRSGVERCLLHILYRSQGGPDAASLEADLSPDVLLSSLHRF